MYKIININDISDEEYARYYSFMTKEKKERVSRFRFEEDKKRTVCGDMLARRMISKYCGVEENSIVFLTDSRGKPYAKNLDVFFNVSHSGSFVICAVSDKPIGADIERIRKADERLIRRCCTDDELEYIFQNGNFDEKANKRFFEIWTAKEAYFKHSGTGITDLKSISVLDSEIKKHIETFVKDDYTVSIYQ